LQAFYGVRSERQLMEQLDYNLLFRWFVGLSPDDPVWDATVFAKNRERLCRGDVFAKFMTKLLNHGSVRPLLSDEHFSVDGTLIEAWASHKSFKPKDGSDDGDGSNFHGQKRKNDTHASKTDPDARLFRKSWGQSSRLCYGGHILTENRNGLIVEATVTHAGTKAERDAALEMLDRWPREHRRTLGADRGYDVQEFHRELRDRNVTPHIAARKDTRLDGRTTRHPGYRISQRHRKRIEEPFGWMKSAASLRRFLHRGLEKVTGVFTLSAAAYNLVRMAKLTTPA